MKLGAVAELARLEFRLALRNRWAWVFAFVFGLSALGIALAGGLGGGELRVDPFPRVAVSLLQLSLHLVPLAALLAGTLSFASDPGHWALLLSQPVGRGEVLLGKALGLFLALMVAILSGFGAAGLLVGLASPAAWPRYVALAGTMVGLGLDFLALGVLLAVAGGRRPAALAAAVAAWFLFVIAYDLAAVGVVILAQGGLGFGALLALLLANPVDLARTLGLLATGATDLLGPVGGAVVRLFGEAWPRLALAATMAAWAAGLLAIAAAVFRRQDA